MSDNDLDKLFKDAAENYPSSFDEGAWLDMEARLSSGNAFTYFKGIGSIIGVFIIGAVLIWWFTPAPEGAGNNNKAPLKDNTVTLPQEPRPGKQRSAEQLKNNTTTGSEIKPGNKSDRLTDEKPPYLLSESSESQATNNRQTNVPGKDGSSKNVPSNSSEITGHKDHRQQVQQRNMKAPAFSEQVKDPELVKRLTYLPFNYSLISGDLEKIKTRQEGVEKEKVLRRQFAIKISYSPDISSAGYFNPDRPGSNYGIMGEYYIGNRWSISVGAIYSRKIYQTEEEETYNYYGNSRSSTTINGDCRVIDIPLNLTYYLKQSDKHSLFLTAGSSSYFMLEEKYDYLTVSNGNEEAWSQEIKGENNHFFGLLNLSIGYERRVKGNLYLQLEPFLKAPVSGIGEGKIDLVSTGAFLNLKYRFR